MKRHIHALRKLLRRTGWDLQRYPSHHELAGHLKQVLARYEIDYVFDVGANCGQFALMLREFGYAGHVVSFEPVLEAYLDLERHAASDAKWDTHRLALSDKNGSLPLNISAATNLSSFLRLTDVDFASSYGGHTHRKETVQVARLDEVIDKKTISDRAFLKIDTQGYDVMVLEGAAGCLPNITGIQIELSVMPIYDEIVDYRATLKRLHELGFTPTGMFPVVRDEGLRAYEFDGVFVRNQDSEHRLVNI